VTDQNTPRPRVIIFRNELLPSSETFILAQANALRRFTPLFAGVHKALRSLPMIQPPVLVSESRSVLGRIMRRVYWRISIAPFFFKRLHSQPSDLVHAHFGIDGAAALPICNTLHVPLIVTLHGYDVSSSDCVLARSPEGRLYLRRREELWSRASVFLCISQFIRDRAIEKGFPANKLRVHYTGTDLALFEFRASDRDDNMILFVGRLVEKKGCSYLLDALSQLRQDHPAVHLVVIGSGPLEEQLQQKAAKEKLACAFLGAQPASIVRDYMARARVFCVPSVQASTGDSEGLGMVFVEAQAMGTPVASFRHGGISEVVVHNRTGLLAPESDSISLKDNLLRLLTDNQLWNQCSIEGPSWVRSKFDITKQTAQLEAIYEDVCQGFIK